jgi:hypothetical protein
MQSLRIWVDGKQGRRRRISTVPSADEAQGVIVIEENLDPTGKFSRERGARLGLETQRFHGRGVEMNRPRVECETFLRYDLRNGMDGCLGSSSSSSVYPSCNEPCATRSPSLQCDRLRRW